MKPIRFDPENTAHWLFAWVVLYVITLGLLSVI